MLKKGDPELVSHELQLTHDVLADLSAWTTEAVEASIRSLQEEHNWHRGQYFMMLRTAVTGRKVSPPLFETIQALDQAVALKRLKQAQELITD